MGHQRMGRLPATRQWRAVIALITGGASAAEIAAATAVAAERGLDTAGNNQALRHAFWLLTQLPLAARQTEFEQALRDLGLDVASTPSLIEISTAMVAAIDKVPKTSGRPDDMSEMATAAAAESLVSVAGRAGESLFGATYAADEARVALHGLATDRQFAVLARDFVARLTRRTISYFLSRVLPDHVGSTRRFQSIKDHHLFDVALETHCREASRIVETFAAEWYSKTNYEGGITPQKAGGFMHVAFGKLQAELRVRRDVHA